MASVGRRQDQAREPEPEPEDVDVPSTARELMSRPVCEVTDLRRERERRRRRTVQPHLPASLQDHIGKHLCATYASLVKEPVPEKILDVLRRLEAGEKKGKNS